MTTWLLKHNWLSIKRSPDFGRKLAVNLILGALLSLVALEFLMLGLFLSRLIKEDLYPGSDPVAVVNGALFFYLGLELMMKLNFQKVRSAAGRPYLLMNVSKAKIAHFILMKTPVSAFKLFPLLVIVPFFFNAVLPDHGFTRSFGWLMTVIALMSLNTYLVNYAKLRFYTNPAVTAVVAGAGISTVLLQKFGIVNFSSLSAAAFGTALRYPVAVLVPVAATILAYTLNHRLLVKNLYAEDAGGGTRGTNVAETAPFLERFGIIGSLVRLDIKLMLRNRRTRISLWMPFLFLFYGLFFYPGGNFDRGDAVSDFMQMFAGMFISGFFIMSYGMMTFCYESGHFGFIQTRKIDMLVYLKARYYFMVIVSTVIYLLSLFYFYFGARIVAVNTAMYIFNVGFTAFFFLFLSTYNKIKFDLSGDIFSMQGKGGNQYSAIFLLVMLLLVLYIPARIFAPRDAVLYLVGSVGLAGLIFHGRLLKLLAEQFGSRRYIMSEGFRHS